MLRYPVNLLLEDDGRFRVEFPDASGAITFGENRAEALQRAMDALESWFMILIGEREAIPMPSRIKRRQGSVELPILAELKVRLYMEMRSQRVGKAELARRLRCHLPQIDRLLDLRHASRLDQLEAALAVLGKRVRVDVEAAA